MSGNAQPPHDPLQAWLVYDQHWRTNVEAFRDAARDMLGHTVGYGQTFLKSMLLLNGGGILA